MPVLRVRPLWGPGAEGAGGGGGGGAAEVVAEVMAVAVAQEVEGEESGIGSWGDSLALPLEDSPAAAASKL